MNMLFNSSLTINSSLFDLLSCSSHTLHSFVGYHRFLFNTAVGFFFNYAVNYAFEFTVLFILLPQLNGTMYSTFLRYEWLNGIAKMRK